jgi:hypothetical protein
MCGRPRTKGTSNPPEVLESRRRQFRVPPCVLNVFVTEVGLQCPRVMPLVGQRVPASMPEHVRMSFEAQLGLDACSLNNASRTALLAMVCCRTAWNWARRAKPEIIPALNPFMGVDLQYKATPTRPVTHAELLRFVKAADKAGDCSIGTAAMIAFYWLQREADIIGRLSWVQHYRPVDNPNIARIYHHKTHELVEMPLYDEDSTVLWPELMERLDGSARRGTLIVMRDKLDRKRKTYLPWKEDYFRDRVAEIRAAAGIAPAAKFMGLRHGGNTQGADADLTNAQLRALSGHRPASMTVPLEQTMKQRREGARKRLAARTKAVNLSE